MSGATLRNCRSWNSQSSLLSPALLLRLGRWFAGFLGKGLHPFEFLLESGSEIVRAVLKKHHEAKGEENEEDEPEKPAKQRHGLMVTYSSPQVNECGGSQLPIDRRFETAILSEPCACPCSISIPNMQPWRGRFGPRSTKSWRPNSLSSGQRSKPSRRPSP